MISLLIMHWKNHNIVVICEGKLHKKSLRCLYAVLQLIGDCPEFQKTVGKVVRKMLIIPNYLKFSKKQRITYCMDEEK